MTPDRAQGVTLYALAALLVVAGGVWFLSAAPQLGEDPRLAAGRHTLEHLVPDLPLQEEAETTIVGPGRLTERSTTVRGGTYALTVACVGEDQLRVRLSTTTIDSGRGIPCADQPQQVELMVTVSSKFFLTVNSESDKPAAFRWRLTRTRTY